MEFNETPVYTCCWCWIDGLHFLRTVTSDSALLTKLHIATFLISAFWLEPQSSAAKKNFVDVYFLPPIAVYAPHSGCDECEHKKFAPAHSSLRSSTITSVFCSKVHGGVHSYRSNKNSRGPSSYQVLWSGERLRKKKKFTQATQRGHDAVLESLLTREQAMKNQDQTNWLPKNLQGIT